MMTDFARLPQIVLVEVFSYLSSNDLLSASSTCSTWRRIVSHPKLWSSKPYRCLRLTLVDRHHDIHSFRYLTRHFLSLARHIQLRFDPTQLHTIDDILQVLDLLVRTNRQIKILLFRPISTRAAPAEQPSLPLSDR